MVLALFAAVLGGACLILIVGCENENSARRRVAAWAVGVAVGAGLIEANESHRNCVNWQIDCPTTEDPR